MKLCLQARAAFLAAATVAALLAPPTTHASALLISIETILTWSNPTAFVGGRLTASSSFSDSGGSFGSRSYDIGFPNNTPPIPDAYVPQPEPGLPGDSITWAFSGTMAYGADGYCTWASPAPA